MIARRISPCSDFRQQRLQRRVDALDRQRGQAFGNLAAAAAVEAAGTTRCCVEATTRCATRHGPQANSLDGPNSASAGRAHGRRDMHRRRIHAGERARAAGQRRQFRQRQRARQVHDARPRDRPHGRQHRRRQRTLALIGCAGDDHREAIGDDEVEQRGRALGRPALEEPARSGMHLHERARRQVMAGKQRRDLLFSRGARHQDQAAIRFVGIHADAPQRVQVLLDHVPLGVRGQPVEMREMPPPQSGALFALARDRPARAQQPREGQAARMLGQVDEEVVAPRPQRAQQRPFRARLRERRRASSSRGRSCALARSQGGPSASARFPDRRARRSRSPARPAQVP